MHSVPSTTVYSTVQYSIHTVLDSVNCTRIHVLLQTRIAITEMDNGLPGAPGIDSKQRAKEIAGRWFTSAGEMVQQLTLRRYTLPDKNVASQVLMYRQLLHTKCRPGLKLSREYQGTPAQAAVKHMPWWTAGIDETKKLEIGYDDLILRLWLHTAIRPHETNLESEECLLIDGKPPVPHDFWVARAGFQQNDPVTDFRSGGVLSLALMVWVAESCPEVFKRFVRPHGDASVLPFAITSINVTGMMSRYLMLSKSVDRMDALLSQKPFWRMFADPYALLACQELSMDLLADVVVELRENRVLQPTDKVPNEEAGDVVSVFDFSHVLSITEKRVENDLLGSGPASVAALRATHSKLKIKYQTQHKKNIENLRESADRSVPETPRDRAQATAKLIQSKVVDQAAGLTNVAASLAGNVLQRFKPPNETDAKGGPDGNEVATSRINQIDVVESNENRGTFGSTSVFQIDDDEE